jgi:hypothetical protein
MKTSQYYGLMGMLWFIAGLIAGAPSVGIACLVIAIAMSFAGAIVERGENKT